VPIGRNTVFDRQDWKSMTDRIMRGRVAVSACAVALALLTMLPASSTAERLLYRYQNAKGVVVIEDRVPPEFVGGGYTVMTRDGRVVEEVPPQLTGAAAERARAAAAEQKRLREWDESLLRRYSTVADIEAARGRALNEFDVRISILRSNLLSVKGQIEREQARAADIERRGAHPPADLVESIADLRREIAGTEETIALRQREREAVEESFRRDIERFESLKDVIEARRRSYGS
jgi:chromosome segregation ATPase